MSFFYDLLLSIEKEDKPIYQKPKLFDIFLYPTLIVICKYNINYGILINL